LALVFLVAISFYSQVLIRFNRFWAICRYGVECAGPD